MHKPTYVVFMDMNDHQYKMDALNGLTTAQFYDQHRDYTKVSEHYSVADAESELKAQRGAIVGSVGLPRA